MKKHALVILMVGTSYERRFRAPTFRLALAAAERSMLPPGQRIKWYGCRSAKLKLHRLPGGCAGMDGEVVYDDGTPTGTRAYITAARTRTLYWKDSRNMLVP